MKSFGVIWRSNIFQKWVMAVTGLFLVLFLIGHLAGNLLVFLGAEHMNEYGHSLRVLFHGSAIWGARLGLVVAFSLHIWSAISLASRNRSARPERYSKVESKTATLASRTMALSGLSMLVYLLYHLAHFTWGSVHTASYAGQLGWEYTLESGTIVPDVYRMVVASFQDVRISSVYILAMVILGLHLNHAVSSAFQTLGVTNPRLMPLIRAVGPVLGLAVALGFIGIPVAVISGIVH